MQPAADPGPSECDLSGLEAVAKFFCRKHHNRIFREFSHLGLQSIGPSLDEFDDWDRDLFDVRVIVFGVSLDRFRFRRCRFGGRLKSGFEELRWGSCSCRRRGWVEQRGSYWCSRGRCRGGYRFWSRCRLVGSGKVLFQAFKFLHRSGAFECTGTDFRKHLREWERTSSLSRPPVPLNAAGRSSRDQFAETDDDFALGQLRY